MFRQFLKRLAVAAGIALGVVVQIGAVRDVGAGAANGTVETFIDNELREIDAIHAKLWGVALRPGYP